MQRRRRREGRYRGRRGAGVDGGHGRLFRVEVVVERVGDGGRDGFSVGGVEVFGEGVEVGGGGGGGGRGEAEDGDECDLKSKVCLYFRVL